MSLASTPTGKGSGDQDSPGEFLSNARNRVGKQVMRWSMDKDNKLLLYAMGKHLTGADFHLIAAMFEEGPTYKSIQERLSKLRQQQNQVLEQAKMSAADSKIPDPPAQVTNETITDYLAGCGYTPADLEALAEIMRGGVEGEDQVEEDEGEGETGFDGNPRPVKRKREDNKVSATFSTQHTDFKQYTTSDTKRVPGIETFDAGAVEAARIRVRARIEREQQARVDALVVRELMEAEQAAKGEHDE